MADLALELVVIHCDDLERSLRFYRALGLDFEKERHGSGSEHYAAKIGPTVFEIYPSTPERPSSAARLGFRVPSLDVALAALTRQNAQVISPPRNTPWGRRAVVKDPDENRVEISE